MTGKYKSLYNRLIGSIDRNRIFDDPLYTLALGTDASFYRLLPEMAIRAKDEAEITLILKECSALNISVTFRAAGTSLSGQAVTDSVLVIAGNMWKKINISEDGTIVRLQPGLTGGRVNRLLSPFARKIGPDPASIDSAMIGGITANNASGMCCGTAQNSYQTVAGIRIVFADGTVLDTSDNSSKSDFSSSHPELLKALSNLAIRVKKDESLSQRIEKKYKIKNTTGYSLNALTDFSDPFDIIEHLMIGSEGTLGFISEVTLKTVPEYKHRATSLIIFPDIEMACRAVSLLKVTPVSAVEIIDRAGLRSIENEPGMPGFLKKLDPYECALLVETVAAEQDELSANVDLVIREVKKIIPEGEIIFTDIRSEYEKLWKIRKGLFPSIGAMRRTGTTVIIEDVAFPLSHLAEATLDLQNILTKNGYHEAVIFGHALEGNLHFVFTQDFSSSAETERYAKLMQDISDLVVKKYDGSLKAEHGTGRNMAPFVELEWGKEAYGIMLEIKRIFDPEGILNPGVILNPEPNVHLMNLKPLPASSEIVDKCTECGFCEPSCVSADLTLTPRQRIAIHREITSLLKTGRDPHRSASLAKSFRYAGDDTCATDGLCATNCPVRIDTGKLIKEIRNSRINKSERIPLMLARNMNIVTSVARKMLSGISFFHKILGTKLMSDISSLLRTITLKKIPLWNPYMPTGADKIRNTRPLESKSKLKVVYFPSCINRSMGVSDDHKDEIQVSEKMVMLLKKAGYEPVYPDNLDNLCCGMAFSSKGYVKAGQMKSRELESALLKAGNNGEYPILCDMSPCLFTMKENFNSDIKLYEPVEFISEFLLPRLKINRISETVTVFPVCSMKKMGLESKLAELARICASEVIVAESNCCGFAGDRGFSYPELNKHGLKDLKIQMNDSVKNGYSTSRTCEIGLSLHSGISYKSIIYLVDQASSLLADQ